MSLKKSPGAPWHQWISSSLSGLGGFISDVSHGKFPLDVCKANKPSTDLLTKSCALGRLESQVGKLQENQNYRHYQKN